MRSYHEIMLDDLKRCMAQRDEVEREWEEEKDRYQVMLEQRDIYFKLYHDTHGKLRGMEVRFDARSYELTETLKERDDARKWAIYYKKKYEESIKAPSQINLLANYIMANHPDAIVDGGAGDVAINIIKALEERIDKLNSMIWRDNK